MDNRQIADRLDAFASLLELADANPYTARAYRRAAETIRAARVPVAELVRTGRVRELRGIGQGIEARLRELVETGDIAELAELERELAPGLVGLGRYLGLGAKRSVEIARALGVRTPEELREAAAAGRLQTVPGIGPKTEARLLEALAREAEPRAQRGLLLNRAWELVGGIANALDGEPAGDVRRWRDSCELLAVVCAAPDPSSTLARFAALPQIVAVIEEDARRALGVTVEGVAVELVAAEPQGFGTALARATGAPAYVAALEPLPDAADEPTRLPRARDALVSPRAARGAVPRRAAGAAGARRHPRRPALPHHLVGRTGECRGDGPRRHRARLRVRRDLRPHAGRRCRPRAHRRRCPPPGRGDRGGERACSRRSASCGGSSATSSPTGGSIFPTTSWPSSTGSRRACTADSGCREREMTKRVVEALRNPYVRCLSHPTGRLINRRPENALDLERVFEVALEEGVALEVNGLPDRLDLRGEHVRDALRAGVRIVCSTDAHSVRGLANMALSVQTARRGWATPADVAQHPAAAVDPRRAPSGPVTRHARYGGAVARQRRPGARPRRARGADHQPGQGPVRRARRDQARPRPLLRRASPSR